MGEIMLLTNLVVTQYGITATNRVEIIKSGKFYVDLTGGKFGEPCIISKSNAGITFHQKQPLSVFTISFWVNIESFSGGWQRIVTANASDNLLWLNGNTLTYYWDGSTSDSFGIPTLNQWIHFWIVQDENEQKFYMNGVEHTSSTKVKQPPLSTISLCVNGFSYFGVKGKFSNFILWDEAIPFSGVPTGLIGYKKVIYIDSNNSVYAVK